jgi:hypothetical protein
MNDITSELAKLHHLTGAEFSRQVECIARRSEFHPLEGETAIYTVGGESSEDYEENVDAAEVIIFKGKKQIVVNRILTMHPAYYRLFKKRYEK